MKKSIAKNYIYNLIYQILTLVLPLITTPYLSRVLGAENIGIYSYTISITTYFILFGSLGIAQYGQREVAYLQEKKDKYSVLFWEIVILRFITMTISMTIFYFTFAINNQYHVYYTILLLELFGNCLDISWFFQGLEEFKKTVTRNIMVKIISIISIFLFVKTSKDLYIYIWIYVLTTLIGNLSLWAYLPKFLTKITKKQINLKQHIKPTIELFIPQIAIQVYTLLDKTMLGKILGDMSEVGNYEQSQKIIKLSLTLVTALGIVVSPRIANTMAKGKKEDVKNYLANSFNFVWFLGMPIMVGIIVVAQKAVPWFLGEDFINSINLLIIGSPIIMAIGLNNVSGVQYLIPARKQKSFSNSVIIGAIFNFCFNLILIPKFKAIGAIISSVMAEIVVFFVQLLYIRKEVPLKIVYENSFKYIISSIIMGIIIYFTTMNMSASMTTTIIQVIIGILVYGIMLIILKDKFLYQIVDKIKNKINEGKKNI